MSSHRLVEYFLVVGVDHEGIKAADSNAAVVGGEGAEVPRLSSPVSPLSPLTEHTATGEVELDGF